MDLQNSFDAAKTNKFTTKLILVYHHTLSMLLHYLEKLKNHLHRHMPGDIIDTAIDQRRKHIQTCVCANGGHLNTFCEQTHANNLHFHVFLV